MTLHFLHVTKGITVRVVIGTNGNTTNVDEFFCEAFVALVAGGIGQTPFLAYIRQLLGQRMLVAAVVGQRPVEIGRECQVAHGCGSPGFDEVES